jgi:hypothetical protein
MGQDVALGSSRGAAHSVGLSSTALRGGREDRGPRRCAPGQPGSALRPAPARGGWGDRGRAPAFVSAPDRVTSVSDSRKRKPMPSMTRMASSEPRGAGGAGCQRMRPIDTRAARVHYYSTL